MRLWSLHPKYLDTKGLLAVWREALLARKVLEGNTKGYKNHSQLVRFNNSGNPISAIDYYLQSVYEESCTRGFCFDKSKLNKAFPVSIPVTTGQVAYEANHLRKKLLQRSPKHRALSDDVKNFKLNPTFFLVDGEVESWEKVL